MRCEKDISGVGIHTALMARLCFARNKAAVIGKRIRFIESKLINQDMADSLLGWRHSGFSVEASIELPGGSSKMPPILSLFSPST
jgi:hypothetical protein